LLSTQVLPEGNDRRVVVAAGELLERNLVELIILGNRDEILAIAEEAGVVISEEAKAHVTIIDPEACDAELFDQLAKGFYELRKHKGVDLEKSKELVRDDPNTFGAMMMKLGLADGMVSGACHSTAATMRPALQLLKTAPGFDIVSSVFFMLLNDGAHAASRPPLRRRRDPHASRPPLRRRRDPHAGVKVFGDCAINVAPSADELAQIAVAFCVEIESGAPYAIDATLSPVTASARWRGASTPSTRGCLHTGRVGAHCEAVRRRATRGHALVRVGRQRPAAWKFISGAPRHRRDVEINQLWERCRVDGVEALRHRADVDGAAP
jgi:hypothetical protein